MQTRAPKPNHKVFLPSSTLVHADFFSENAIAKKLFPQIGTS